MSFLPRLDDASLLADLSLAPDDEGDTTFACPPTMGALPHRHPLGMPQPRLPAPGLMSHSASNSKSSCGDYPEALSHKQAPQPQIQFQSHSRSASASSSRSHASTNGDYGVPNGQASAFGQPPPPMAGAGRTARPRFSLFAPGAAGSTSGSGSVSVGRGFGKPHGLQGLGEEKEREDAHVCDDHEEGDETVRHGHQGDDAEGEHAHDEKGPEGPPAQPDPADTKTAREERLRASLVELRKFNKVFGGFYDALSDAQGHNERLVARVQETNALLDKYIEFHAQTLHTRNLILNPRWTGSKGDEEAVKKAEERAAEEAHREAERLADEERARAEDEAEAEAVAVAARTAAARGRGGTRGSVGGRGGMSSGIAHSSARGGSRGGSRIARPQSTGIPTRNTRPTAGTGASGSGSRPTSAAGGRWGHVQSSGYGPGGVRR